MASDAGGQLAQVADTGSLKAKMDASTDAIGAARKTDKKALLNLFIICYGLGSFIMCCPPSKFRDATVSAIKPLFDCFGLYQFFYMYAPDPPSVHRIHICADISFADGTSRVWEFPALDSFKSDFYKHQSKHRYYQWKYYLFFPGAYPQILPDAARWAARMNWDPKNPPVRVVLFNRPEITLLPAVDTGRVTALAAPGSEFFTYQVRPGDL